MFLLAEPPCSVTCQQIMFDSATRSACSASMAQDATYTAWPDFLWAAM